MSLKGYSAIYFKNHRYKKPKMKPSTLEIIWKAGSFIAGAALGGWIFMQTL